jgi:hypothetical protein
MSPDLEWGTLILEPCKLALGPWRLTLELFGLNLLNLESRRLVEKFSLMESRFLTKRFHKIRFAKQDGSDGSYHLISCFMKWPVSVKNVSRNSETT